MKYKLGVLLDDGYCGIEVLNEKDNISNNLRSKKSYSDVYEYEDKKYRKGRILKKLGKWQRRKQLGISSQ